ncbi:hypothetical protein AVEN_209770-1 [Araneus ventricosus]|uniref:Uncharacterized protein n=1 Tax=Araneus ventricosus TaxID=182803 RepID=A0A4Y2CFH6_ARAVE|nr:hypothetical protein AVEN_209770-1 [Araneus ventricosus]
MVTNQSTFTREGMFNAHNFHVWSEENLREQDPMHPGKVFTKRMGQHHKKPPLRAVLVARTSDRCKLFDLPSASIAAAVGRRARIRMMVHQPITALPCVST